ncbi:DUF928 domain-containing protein [Candidatus Nitrospira bockiana]
MKAQVGIAFAVAVAVLSLGSPSTAQGPHTSAPTQAGAPPSGDSTPQSTTVAVPTYKPPLRHAPGGRVGGGTRGTGDGLPVLSVAAPDHLGLTTQEQPTLYWYVSEITALPIEISIINEQVIPPVLEKRLVAPVHPGLQAVRLSDYGVTLEPDVPYQWHVSIIRDPKRRSNDLSVGAAIARVARSTDLQQRLAQAQDGEATYILAEAGLWYDAIDFVSTLIAQAPTQTIHRLERAALFEQVGLHDLAVLDRRAR